MRSPNTELPPCTFEHPFLNSSGLDNGSMMRLMNSAEVYLEFFRGLPIQLRVRNDHGEYICMLPHRFQQAYAKVMVKLGERANRETEWTFFGRRHGDLEEVAERVGALAARARLVLAERAAERVEDGARDVPGRQPL